jgi:alpha-N-acetylglucosaminidase
MNSFSCLGSRSIGQNLFILVLLVMASGGAVARAGAIDAAQGVVVRILPEKSDEFVLEEIPAENQHDVFEIESSGGKIVLRGNNGVSIASAFNWYLKYYCNCQISWSGDQLRVPDPLPAVKAKVHIASPFLYRYDLNYCTHAYSMAWWDWNRWQRELDWMAMNGINLPLLITGEEGVWQATLSQLGYSDMEIKSWLTSPAHFPWQWMSNIQSWGGPLPQSWIDRRLDLARQIISRAKELGMSPVFQGYYGIVPAGFRDRFPNAHVLDQGDWSGFTRPQMLDPTDPIFAHVAETFYQQQQKLLGTAKFFSADPFHEGGSTRGLDVAKCAKAIQAEMFKVDPAATWVLQGWQGNPKEALLNGIDKDHALVLDLSGDSGNEWRRRNGFDGTPWAWCIVHNFGGRPGMFGNLAAIANGPPQAMRDPRANRLVGTGLLMEGIEQNPIVYDLMTEMGWRNQSPDLIQCRPPVRRGIPCARPSIHRAMLSHCFWHDRRWRLKL